MIVFVGDKPSKRNLREDVAFIGTPSFSNLIRWIPILNVFLFRMVNSYTHDDFVKICQYYNSGECQFVALGNDASKRLTKRGIEHFKLPHPSPRNRKLNDKNFIDLELKKCKDYLKGKGKCVLFASNGNEKN